MPAKRTSKSRKSAQANADVQTEDVNFYNIHEGLTGRAPGFYLDDLERIGAEDRRAVIEDRDPDYENMGATAGSPLVPAGLLPLPVQPMTDDQVGIEPFVTLPVAQTVDSPTTISGDELGDDNTRTITNQSDLDELGLQSDEDEDED
jgi:hypothetical protein